MRSKTLLLGSVSALATAIAGAQVAKADSLPPPPQGFTYSVEGGAIFSTEDSDLADKASSLNSSLNRGGSTGTVVLNDFPTDVGYHGAVSLGKQFGQGLDVTMGASLNRLIDNGASLTGNATSGGDTTILNENMTTSFSFETADFEVGFTPQLDNGMHVRLFGGIRALHFVNNSSTSGIVVQSSGGGPDKFSESASESFNTEFFGAGPRAGLQVDKRFDGSNFGISGEFAGAVAFGRQSNTSTEGFSIITNGSGGAIGPLTTTTTSMATIYDLEAKAGVDYYLDDNNKLTVGYRAEDILNINIPNGSFGSILSGSGSSGGTLVNKLTHGPFVKLTGGF